jgi:hypothetical protein
LSADVDYTSVHMFEYYILERMRSS